MPEGPAFQRYERLVDALGTEPSTPPTSGRTSRPRVTALRPL